jgi:hypothetical protein
LRLCGGLLRRKDTKRGEMEKERERERREDSLYDVVGTLVPAIPMYCSLSKDAKKV